MDTSPWLPALEPVLGSDAHTMHLAGTHSTACCTAPPSGWFFFFFRFFSAILNSSPGYFLIPTSILCAFVSPAQLFMPWLPRL